MDLAVPFRRGDNRAGKDLPLRTAATIARRNRRRNEDVVPGFTLPSSGWVRGARGGGQTLRRRHRHGASFVFADGAIGSSRQLAGLERRGGTTAASGGAGGRRSRRAGSGRAAGVLAIGTGPPNPRAAAAECSSRNAVYGENVTGGFAGGDASRKRSSARRGIRGRAGRD